MWGLSPTDMVVWFALIALAVLGFILLSILSFALRYQMKANRAAAPQARDTTDRQSKTNEQKINWVRWGSVAFYLLIAGLTLRFTPAILQLDPLTLWAIPHLVAEWQLDAELVRQAWKVVATAIIILVPLISLWQIIQLLRGSDQKSKQVSSWWYFDSWGDLVAVVILLPFILFGLGFTLTVGYAFLLGVVEILAHLLF